MNRIDGMGITWRMYLIPLLTIHYRRNQDASKRIRGRKISTPVKKARLATRAALRHTVFFRTICPSMLTFIRLFG